MTNEELLIIGASLGDGSLNRRHSYENVCSFSVSHSEKQLEYLEWKVSLLKPILNSKAKIHSGINNCGSKYFSWEAGCSKYVHLYNALYINKKKTFSCDILKHLGIRELALFWCDDGGVSKILREKTDPRTGKKYPNLLQETYGTLAVYKSKEETENVQKWIEELTGSKSSNVLHKKTGLYFLRFNKKNLQILVNSIKSEVPECMFDKIDLSQIPLSERARLSKERGNKRARVRSNLVSS